MKSMIVAGILVALLLIAPARGQLSLPNSGVDSLRVVVGVRPGYNFVQAIEKLGAYGKVINTIPEINAVTIEIPAQLINAVYKLSFIKYLEEDVLVQIYDVYTMGRSTPLEKVFFSSYTANLSVNEGENTAVNYTIKNNAKSSVNVAVELFDHNNNIIASKTHSIPARGSASGSLPFTAPTSAGNYTYKLALKNVSTGTTYDLEYIAISVYTPSQPTPPPSPPPPTPPPEVPEPTPLPPYTDGVGWNIRYVKAPDVWHTYNSTNGLGALGHGIQVAVLDTGIDYTHPELQGAVVWCAVYLNLSTIVYEGYDLSMCMDGHSHGTHVAGIIRASMNNASIVGVSPLTQLYAVKVISDSGSGYASDLAKGIIEASKGPDDIAGTDDDADVISMSLGGGYSKLLEDAVKFAYNNGAVLVAAAGNTGGSTPLYPAAYSEVIAVGAIDSSYQVPTWSNRNPDVVAPGVGIYSTVPGGTLGYKTGTSMACPHVSGVVALIQALRVSAEKLKLTPSQVFELIKQTSTDLGKVDYDELYGYGLVNAYEATRLALST
ncbi:MAG: S8 family peptidase [Desulfurococcaceae archaeon]